MATPHFAQMRCVAAVAVPTAAPTPAPTAPAPATPAAPAAAVALYRAPADCRDAKSDPAATLPMADYHAAARLPASTPEAVKPVTLSATGPARTIAATPAPTKAPYLNAAALALPPATLRGSRLRSLGCALALALCAQMLWFGAPLHLRLRLRRRARNGRCGRWRWLGHDVERRKTLC